LFVQRAQAVQPDFRLTEANSLAIATLCGRLDGLPLALELAAARMRVFPPEAILARLGERRGRLELLRARGQDRQPRHKGLHETIGWSYGLLDPAEQALFRQLAVFAGPWTPEAAEAIVGRSVLDELALLVNKSLLAIHNAPAPDGEPLRFAMLETIREYAVEHLDEAGEAPRTRDRHAAYYLALAERVDATLRGPNLRDGLSRLAAEQGNLRAALAWCMELGEGVANDHGLRLAVALSWAWYVRGDYTEGRLWFERALAPEQTAGSTEMPEWRAPRALALARAAAFAFRQGDIGSARALLEQSRATAQALGDLRTKAEALHWQMLVLEAAEGLGAGVPLLEQSLRIYHALDDAWGISWSLGNLARVSVEQGAYERAARLASEALAWAETARDPWMVGWWLHLHWVLARSGLQRDSVRPAEALEGRVPESDLLAVPDGRGSSRVKIRQASLLASMAESLILRRDLGNRSGVIQSLEDFAWVACVRAQARLASRLVGAADGLRRAVGQAVDALSVRDREALEVGLHARLSDAEFEAEYAVGASMSTDRAIAEALEMAAPRALAAGQARAERTGRGKPSLLSPREREVAALAAQGLMNREIAERLVVSERTVEAHVAHILAKLGIASRVQLAAWVVANER
jgi:DNA-binding CsgD family transcriptional regulator